MANKQAWRRLKADLELSQEVLVGGDSIPYEAPHLLMIGSSKKDLDQEKMSQQLKDYVGLPNFVLPRSPNYLNFYPFIVYLSAGEPNLFNSNTGEWETIPVVVDSIEDWVDGADAAFVVAAPLEDIDDTTIADLENAAKNQTAPSTDPDVPIVLSHEFPLDPTEWVNLRVHFSDMAPLSTVYLQTMLQDLGYKVIAPDRGITGIFVRTSSVAGPKSTSVFFHPNNHTISGDDLQSVVFDQFGFTDGIPNAIVSLYTSETTQNSQQLLNFVWRAQATTGASSDFLNHLLDALNKILTVLPKVLWIALGGIAIYGGWRVFQFARVEYRKSRRSTNRLEKRYEEA